MSVSLSMAAPGFDGFGLNEALVRGVRGLGFETPRPIQAETIPAGLLGRDVLGLAQTGTGKTAAFALPLLHRILTTRGQGPRALVVAPTRELATQIAAEISALSKFARINVLTIFGGASMGNQIRGLRRRPEVIVGCPGRLLDLFRQGVLHLDGVETLVLDEADHMFDMGFLPDVRRIIAALPAQRQNLLFSATMPQEIRRLANDLLVEPHVVDLAGRAPASTIDHALYLVAEPRKRDLLEHLLNGDDCKSAIIFTRTKHRARRLAEQLSNAGHRAVALQGNMSQPQRDRAMQGFRKRQFDFLVATDIAARGIDVSDVSHVINFDVPTTPEAYTHRIGRTGRAELEGVACTFVTSDDRAWVRATERMIGAAIPRRQAEGIEVGFDEHARAPRAAAPQNGYRRNAPSGNAPNRAGGGGRANSPRTGQSFGQRTAQTNGQSNDNRSSRGVATFSRGGARPGGGGQREQGRNSAGRRRTG